MLFIVFLFGCDKDEVKENPVKKNYIKYDGKESVIKSVVVYTDEFSVAKTNADYELQFVVLGEGFTYSPQDDVTGKGDAMIFSIYTNTLNLNSGTYTLKKNVMDLEVNDLFGFSLGYQFNAQNITFENLITDFDQLTLTLTKDANQYTFEWQGKKGGKDFSAYYSGEIIRVE